MKAARVVGACAIIGAAACTTILGNDFEIGMAGAGGSGAQTTTGGQGGTGAQGGAGGQGGSCDEVPTMAEACADACGELEVCGELFSCPSDCAGELTCGAEVANSCGCANAPCALSGGAWGDLANERITALAVDQQGNTIVGGDFRGSLELGTETFTNAGSVRYDAFLAKLDPDGQVLWAKHYFSTAGDNDEQILDLDVDQADNIVFLGETYRDIDLGGGVLTADSSLFVAKLAPDGSHIFSDVYQTEFTVNASSIAASPSGDVVLTGQFWGTLQMGSLSSITAVGTQSYYDIFVATLAPDGTPQRLKRFGDGNEQAPEDIVVNDAGDVFLASTFTGTFDFGPPSPVTVSTNTFYSLALVKLTSTNFLTHGWTRQLGTEVYSVRLAQAPSNGLYVAGGFSDLLDIVSPPLDSANGGAFIALLDADGNTVWAHQLDQVTVEDIASGPDGSVTLVGSGSGPVDFGGGPVGVDNGTRDLVIARLDADGVQVFARAFEAPVGDQDAAAVSVGPAGSSSVGVNFEGQADFGAGPVNSQGQDDVAVIRYAAP